MIFPPNSLAPHSLPLLYEGGKKSDELRRLASFTKIMFRKADSSGDLAPAVERLHALADRLEVRRRRNKTTTMKK